MSTTAAAPNHALPFTQAVELSLLVDLEARWENLRICEHRAGMATEYAELHEKQKAYDAFIARLTKYNKTHKPAHVAELLLNTASRLGTWCWGMRDLVLQVQHDAQSRCPTHLLAKAYRWADRVAAHLKTEPISRSTPSITIPAAIQELEVLARWCDNLPGVAS